MNRHDDAEQRVRAWLTTESHGELPDWVLGQAFSITRSTPQDRGLRGWLGSIRAPRASTTRRRNRVFTLATLTGFVATAVLAVGFLVDTSQPSTPGAEVPADSGQAPAITVEDQMFSGSFTYGPSCEDDDGNEIAYCWEQALVTFDDPRFQGTVTMLANSDHVDQGVYRNQFTIATDDGVWRGDAVPGILDGPDDGAPTVHLFTGEGAYEGLHAVATVDLSGGVFILHGYVVDGGFPELPAR